MKTVFSVIFIAVIIASVISEFVYIYLKHLKNAPAKTENAEKDTDGSADNAPADADDAAVSAAAETAADAAADTVEADCAAAENASEEEASVTVIAQEEPADDAESKPGETVKNTNETVFDKKLSKFALSKKSVGIIAAVTAAACVALYFLTIRYKKDNSILNGFINAEILGWLTAIGIVDLKKKKIPNAFILAGLAFWVVVTVLDIVVGKTPIKDSVVFSLIGGGICGAILFIISIISKGALGMGDVKLFTVLGLLCGIFNVYSILLWTVILMAVVSIILMIAKKADRKTRVPMAPFVILGFLLEIVTGV